MAALSSMKNTVQERLRRVEGRLNALVKELRRTFARGELTESGACAIEGLRIVEEAIRSGLKFEAVFFSDEAEAKAERLLRQMGAHVETLVLPEKLFAGGVPGETPQGVAALVGMKEFSIEDIISGAQRGADNSVPATRAGILVGVAGVQDPGNLGTILRSAEAFGAGGIVLGEGTVSVFNPKVVRASAGSVFRIPVVRTKLADAAIEMKKHGLRLIATSSHKGAALDQANLSGPLVIFIDSEGAGLSRDLIK